jgi:hypothetical protein
MYRTYEEYLRGIKTGEFEADFDGAKYTVPSICKYCTYHGKDPGECDEIDRWPDCKYMREG